MARHAVVKQLWVYIKGNQLQDPSNKRKILCDEKLQALFGKAVVDSFEMAKVSVPPNNYPSVHHPTPVGDRGLLLTFLFVLFPCFVVSFGFAPLIDCSWNLLGSFVSFEMSVNWSSS